MGVETKIGKLAQLKASECGARLFRNNNGMAIHEGRPVFYGLGHDNRKDGSIGSSDYIGWQTIEITQDMVGKKMAQFLAVEIKTPGSYTNPKRLEKQKNFIAQVIQSGGKGGIITSPEDLTSIL